MKNFKNFEQGKSSNNTYLHDGDSGSLATSNDYGNKSKYLQSNKHNQPNIYNQQLQNKILSSQSN